MKPANRVAAALQKAVSAQKQGRPAEAEKWCRAALELQPADAQTHIQIARLLERIGQRGAAADVMAAATSKFPREPALYLYLGNLLTAAGNWPGARLCYATCCKLQPENAVAQHNFGVSLNELGKPQEAVAAFERAIGLNPQYDDAYYSLGLTYQGMNAFDAALLAFECAAGINPAHALYSTEHVRTLTKAGKHAQALAKLDETDGNFPASAERLNLRGIALRNLGRAQEALEAYDQALALDADCVEALNNRANMYLRLRRFSAALADFDRVAALKPGVDWVAGGRLYAALHLFDWIDFEPRLRGLLDDVARQRRGVQPLVLQYALDDPAAQQAAARVWMKSACKPRAEVPLRPRGEAGAGRVKVAYVSRDFRSHPVSFLMAEVIELHDRERFEIFAINYGAASDDAMQQRLRGAFDHFLDVEQLSDKKIAELCASLGVDIAVDLTGLTDNARTSIFSWRAAPVQMMYLGYLGTAGSDVFDYLIADPVLIDGGTRRFYDEHVIYLPSYQANDRRRPRPEAVPERGTLGLPGTGFVYCCFNNPCKITPAVFEAWMEVLRQVPESVLWVLSEDESADANLRRQAECLGVEGRRIVFGGRTGRENYLAMQRAADVFLDTLPYNAGTTASDALWMGLPVLTQLGQSFAARMAASLLHAVGLPELVAKNTREYIDVAVRLARDADFLGGIRKRLEDGRQACALFDAPRFTRHLEHAYLQAHRIHLAGEAARDFSVEEASAAA